MSKGKSGQGKQRNGFCVIIRKGRRFGACSRSPALLPGGGATRLPCQAPGSRGRQARPGRTRPDRTGGQVFPSAVTRCSFSFEVFSYSKARRAKWPAACKAKGINPGAAALSLCCKQGALGRASFDVACWRGGLLHCSLLCSSSKTNSRLFIALLAGGSKQPSHSPLQWKRLQFQKCPSDPTEGQQEGCWRGGSARMQKEQLP